MNEHTVRKFGFLLAEQARMYAMLAANEHRKHIQAPPQYDEQDFHQLAFQIENIARDV